jgi:hypothetical protein
LVFRADILAEDKYSGSRNFLVKPAVMETSRFDLGANDGSGRAMLGVIFGLTDESGCSEHRLWMKQLMHFAGMLGLKRFSDEPH